MLEDSVQRFFIVSSKNYVKAYFKMYLCGNLSLGMFLRCSYFFTISEADVLINSVLRQNTACSGKSSYREASFSSTAIPAEVDVCKPEVEAMASPDADLRT